MLQPFRNRITLRQLPRWPRWGIRLRVMLSSLVITLGITYWGYCWGWWLRSNLLAQYIFQCRCPAASEPVRYAPFRIIVPACEHAVLADLSPQGMHALLLRGEQNQPLEVVLLDAQLRATHSFVPQTKQLDSAYFFSDQFLVLGIDRRNALFDLKDGQFGSPEWLPPMIDYRTARMTSFAPCVIYIRPLIGLSLYVPQDRRIRPLVIELGFDPKERSAWANDRGLRLVETPVFPFDAHHHPWSASDGSIYDRRTRATLYSAIPPQHTTDYPAMQVMGWTGDDRLVLYNVDERPYLIHLGQFPLPTWLNFFPVRQPQLALDVPESLLTSPP